MGNVCLLYVTLANNHCLDRGKEGLANTIKNVRSVGLQTVGAYLTNEESSAIFNIDFDGCKVVLLSYTHGTNSKWQNNALSEEEDWCVDLFRKQGSYSPHSIGKIEKEMRKMVKRVLPHSIELKLRNLVVYQLRM